MGSRLLNGSPQLNVRVTLFPLVLLSTLTLGTVSGIPEMKLYYVRTYLQITTQHYVQMYETHTFIAKNVYIRMLNPFVQIGAVEGFIKTAINTYH